jgi:hypothetical protein
MAEGRATQGAVAGMEEVLETQAQFVSERQNPKM